MTRPGAEGREAADVPSTWLVLGPMSGDSARWQSAVPRLGEHLRLVHPQARVLPLDLPGSGALRRARSPAQVAGIVSELRQRLSAEGIQGPFGLVASSWACAVAVEWARSAPAEAPALVLLSPAFRPFTPVLRSVRMPLWPQAAVKLLRRGGLARLAAVWRYRSSRRRPHSRVLLLAGKTDEWMDWRVAAAVSRAWGAALRVHAEAGHDLLGCEPDWVGRSLAEWLMPVGSGRPEGLVAQDA